MKNKLFRIIFSLIILFVVVASCAPAESTQVLSSDNSQNEVLSYQTCLSGVTTIPIKVTNNGVTAEFVQAYVQIPNEGCSMPALYCSFIKRGYGAGGGCVVIEE